MPEVELSNQQAREALEKFVVENDDLLELEERIGRFNIFEALGIARAEIRHSNFLAWLLDPNESHGQGSLFLKAILMDLLKQTPAEMRPLNPIELDGEELRGVEIRREWRCIDILITCQQPAFVIAIENKVDSGEHSEQLQRYKRVVAQHFPDHKAMFVFLNTVATESSDRDWLPYSYADTHRVLKQARQLCDQTITDVLAFLDHYLSLIGSWSMNDPVVDRLCNKIFKEHRRAIDLIWKRTRESPFAFIRAVATELAQDARLRVIETRLDTRPRTMFRPGNWSLCVPPIGNFGKWGFAPDDWLYCQVFVVDQKLQVGVWAGTTSDVKMRQRVLKRLTSDHWEFGLRAGRRSDEWTDLYVETIADVSELDFEDHSLMVDVKNRVDKLLSRLIGVPAALQPLFDEWRASQPTEAAQR